MSEGMEIRRWKKLVSDTNWKKGKIAIDWMVETGKSAEDFATEVGGVTSNHIKRLVQTYRLFGASYKSYRRLSWAHFCAVVEWEDASVWLDAAEMGNWTVAQMRMRRWAGEP